MSDLGYMRVSTPMQDPRLQRSALIKEGVDPANIWFDEVTGSSSTGDRSQWSALLTCAQPGDVVIVWRIDRLGRSLSNVLATVAELRGRGVGIRSISDGIDPATSGGRFALNMFASVAEYERELARERVVAGMNAARESGVHVGRPPADPAIAERALREEGMSVAGAAALVGWSRVTLWRRRSAAGAFSN